MDSDRYLVVNDCPQLHKVNTMFHSITLLGGVSSGAELIGWANETWGPYSPVASMQGPRITTVEQAVQACAKGGWRVLKLLPTNG